MDNIIILLSYFVVFFGLVNLIRISIFLIGADFYLLKNLKNKQGNTYLPKISVVIPAFNEEKSIESTVLSVFENDYPKDKLEIIVVDDGSTDKTYLKVKDIAKSNLIENLFVITQQNKGKAHALNNGIKNYSSGELIMCLDADSYIAKDALRNAVKYFYDDKVVALASNVKIVKSNGLLNLVQIFEYIVSYQMKKALTVFQIEYIIGGVGSMFRKNFIEKLDFYDVNTVTEDIDLTMKILKNGGKEFKVIYASDVRSYTQSVLSIKDLVKQRYRWKWGRYQTFLKNKKLFFSTNKKYNKRLSWFYLPFAVYSDVAFFFEPIVLFFMMILIFVYHDITSLTSAVMVVCFFMSINILGEESLTLKEKIIYILITPFMYFLFYILSYVEYAALIKSWIKIPHLSKSLLENKSHWKPVERQGLNTTISA